MNIILCSEKFENNDINGNSNRIINTIRKHRNSKIEFIFFGEAFLNGFDALSWKYADDIAMKESTIKYVKLLGEKAKQYNRGLGFGYFEFENNKVYSSYIIYNSKGEIICNYRRISKGWRINDIDTDIYSEGNTIGEFHYKGIHFGVALCGDIWHDALYNEILNRNFDVLIWPVYTNYSIKEWDEKEKFEYMMRSKGLATHVLYVNSISDEPSFGGTYFQSYGKLIEDTSPLNEEFCKILTLDKGFQLK